MHAGMKKRDECLGHRIDRGEIRTFEAITVRARQGEIGRIVVATVLAGTNVLDMEAHHPGIPLGQQAVLTPMTRAFANKRA